MRKLRRFLTVLLFINFSWGMATGMEKRPLESRVFLPLVKGASLRFQGVFGGLFHRAGIVAGKAAGAKP